MKKQTLKTLMAAFLIGVSGIAMAGNDLVSEKKPKKEQSRTLDVNIYPRQNGLVAVNFLKKEDETIRVSIYNSYGDRVYTERVKTHEIVTKKYDISNLPERKYYFEVSNGSYLVRQVIRK